MSVLRVGFPGAARHDLFSCKMQAKSRAESQVKALERLYELEDLRPKEKE
jgi:hypothetical protein